MIGFFGQAQGRDGNPCEALVYDDICSELRRLRDGWQTRLQETDPARNEFNRYLNLLGDADFAQVTGQAGIPGEESSAPRANLLAPATGLTAASDGRRMGADHVGNSDDLRLTWIRPRRLVSRRCLNNQRRLNDKGRDW